MENVELLTFCQLTEDHVKVPQIHGCRLFGSRSNGDPYWVLKQMHSDWPILGTETISIPKHRDSILSILDTDTIRDHPHDHDHMIMDDL